MATHRNAAFLSPDELAELDFAHLGKDVLIHSTCVLVNCQRMSIGDGVRIDPFCVLSPGSSLEIGDHVHIAAQCVLMGSAAIALGDFAGLSHGVKILSASDDFVGGSLIGPTIPDAFRTVDARPVRLARHAVIGAGGLVLPGSTIEEGATVGSLSLVKGSLAAWTVNAGTPARKVRDRDRDGVLDAERRFRASRPPRLPRPAFEA
ncbi:acetyltransferase [Rhizorhabdus wittichii DC-6]|uniref:Acetyltransferase (Isoleucine patch superfamily)-like protein n=2 Tax=Rhizorhabdus wittichii TaxID=160791 RepID=A0A9J9LCT7_RHIWR|nr:acyltransferase [Rhizorhabdus wittichii]ABQ67160.1 Acetyltransferase (isoleucine patch superfamily)-like protein [Rhizorhabdus wittichii RW1]ARR56064.1 acetyltransferase [Rhizorhabdus wittichii DC-6]QTH23161.1 acyltransferase [Rhizorhabdus wittichii]